jgi:hypothetical protein
MTYDPKKMIRGISGATPPLIRSLRHMECEACAGTGITLEPAPHPWMGSRTAPCPTCRGGGVIELPHDAYMARCLTICRAIVEEAEHDDDDDQTPR